MIALRLETASVVTHSPDVIPVGRLVIPSSDHGKWKILFARDLQILGPRLLTAGHLASLRSARRR